MMFLKVWLWQWKSNIPGALKKKKIYRIKYAKLQKSKQKEK